MNLLKTPLHVQHCQLGAKLVPFAGYEMPLSYDPLTGGLIKEHHSVRKEVGIFDVSHMGEFWLTGPQATDFLSWATTRPFDRLSANKAQYCLLLNEKGGIVDDIIVYKIDSENYWIVVNASNIQKDFSHLTQISQEFKVQLQNVSDETALIAVQGPKAESLVSKLLPSCRKLPYYGFEQTSENWILGRTGYTGEDGFEIFMPAKSAIEVWNSLIKGGAVPIGLGARDTLRLEVGFPLYGHELSDELFPDETFAAFAAPFKGPHLGLEKLRLRKPRYLPIALISDTPKPIRAEEPLIGRSGEKIGWVTSGSTSPMLKLGVGLGLCEVSKFMQNENTLKLESGGKIREVKVTSLPFVETARVKRRIRPNEGVAKVAERHS